MTNANETGQKGHEDIQKKAINEATKEINDAKNHPQSVQKLKELVDQYVQGLKRVVRQAGEVVENAEKSRKGEEIFIKTEERNKVTYAIFKLFEATKQGVVITSDPVAQTFLRNIVQKIDSPTPDECSHLAVYLTSYLLGEKPIVINRPNEQKSEFQRDFEALAKINPRLAEDIKEALKKTAREGNISIPEDLIDQLKIPSEIDEESDQIGKTRRRRMLTEKEREEYIKIWRDIMDRYSRRVTSNQKKTGDDEKIMKINLVFTKMRSGDIDLLRDMGYSDEEIKRFIQLREGFNQDLNTEFLGQYTPILEPVINQAKIDFAEIDRFFTIDNKGKITMSKDQKQEFEELIRKYYYRGLSIIHQNTSQDFHSILRERSELGHYFSLIGQVVTYACDRIKERLPDSEEYRELRLFFEDKSESFLSRIMNNAKLFHNLPLYARNLGSVEEIKKLFSYIYPSQLAEVFDDKTNLMAIARDELTMLLREYLVINNNQYTGDLISGEYKEKGARWSDKFKENFKERLKQKLIRLGLYKGEKDEWKLDMLRTYADGIGIATLTDPEILVTSDPVSHFREVHPLMTLLSAKHNWKGGRGQMVPGLINRFLLGMDVDLFPQRRSFISRLISKKEYDPKKYYEEVEEKIRDYSGIVADEIPDRSISGVFKRLKKKIEKKIHHYGGAIADEMNDGKAKVSLFGMGGLYQELISMFSVPGSIDSWHGWRVDGVKNELNKIFEIIYGKNKMESHKDWQEFFDLSLELYGVTSLWWQIGVFGGARPVEEMKLFLGEDRFKQLSLRANDKVIEVDGRKMTFFELRMWRMNQLRAELFFRYLRRNPGDFLQIISQLCPDILDKEGKVFKDEKHLDEKGKVKQRALKKRWGESGFQFFSQVNQWLIKQSQEVKKPGTDKPFSDVKEFMIYFRERTSDAFERMRLRNEEARRQIIEIASKEDLSDKEKREQINQVRQRSFYLKKEDFNGDDNVWRLFAEGDQSFFTLITGLSYERADEYFSNFGSFNKLGKKTIFFDLANNWFLRNGDINPFTADIAYYDIFRHIPLSGESTLSRLWDADISAYKEVISQIPNLENLLLEAAQTNNLEKIYALHKKIFDTLSGLVGPEYAYRANYILAQIVSNFFKEHSILRDPKWKWLGPVGWLARVAIGLKGNTSLSKILTNNRHAFSMDNNALRTYFMRLSHHMNVLPITGMFSKEQLEQVFEVTKLEIVTGDIAPSLAWFIILFMLFMAMRKMMEDEKKKG